MSLQFFAQWGLCEVIQGTIGAWDFWKPKNMYWKARTSSQSAPCKGNECERPALFDNDSFPRKALRKSLSGHATCLEHTFGRPRDKFQKPYNGNVALRSLFISESFCKHERAIPVTYMNVQTLYECVCCASVPPFIKVRRGSYSGSTCKPH